MDTQSVMVPTLQIPHILLVDASLEDQQLYDCWLTTSGCRVTQARDGFEALAAVHDDPPDVVVTDLALPDMDGLELCDRLRAEPRLPGVSVILLADRVNEATAALRRMHAFDHAAVLPTPCAPHIVMTTIHRLLGRCLALRERSDAARRRAAVLCRQSRDLHCQSLEELAHQRPAWRQLLDRVGRDFGERPALNLTARAAAIRWETTEALSSLVLECLCRRGLLEHAPDGRFARVGSLSVRTVA